VILPPLWLFVVFVPFAVYLSSPSAFRSSGVPRLLTHCAFVPSFVPRGLPSKSFGLEVCGLFMALVHSVPWDFIVVACTIEPGPFTPGPGFTLTLDGVDVVACSCLLRLHITCCGFVWPSLFGTRRVAESWSSSMMIRGASSQSSSFNDFDRTLLFSSFCRIPYI
jgi:hypothetical protein